MRFIRTAARRAQALHAEAQQLEHEGKEDAAIERYLAALALDPDKSESYYNLGLIHKYRGEWERSLDYNASANRLDPDDQASRWNLAIAATALRRWELARAAWRQNGIRLDGDDGPIEMNFGITPVRLNPDDRGEVVWATRIDPVRARIDNIPYPESGFRHGDIVLHDGAPVGSRMREGREYMVFNVLELFEASPYATAVLTVELPHDHALGELDAMLTAMPAAREYALEDWTSNVHILCKQCSEGVPHEHHDDQADAAWVATRKLGLAFADVDGVQEVLLRWQEKTRARVLSFDLALRAAPGA